MVVKIESLLVKL